MKTITLIFLSFLNVMIWGMEEYAVEPSPKRISFKDIKDIVKSLYEKDFSKDFYRTATMQAKYNKQRSEYYTALDMIHIQLFGSEPVEITDENGMTLKAKEQTIKTEGTFILPNTFPYHMEEGIEHFVYWDLGYKDKNGEKSRDELKLILEEIKNFFSCGENHAENILVFQNPPQSRSISDIYHLQIFLTRQSKMENRLMYNENPEPKIEFIDSLNMVV